MLPALPPFSSFRLAVPRSILALVMVLLLGVPGLARATPTLGFVEHFTTGTGNWSGGDFLGNPGTGGVLGAGDGFLTLTTPGPSPFFTNNLGSRNLGPEYAGNWTAAGINRVKFYLNDIGSANPLEMHFCIGNGTNFWQYNTGFIPPAGSWSQFTVDLTSANWTQIVGPGTFAAALQAGDRILIRHDVAPYTQTPDPISADVGIDEVSLEFVGNTGVPRSGPSGTTALTLAAPYANPSHGAVALAIESSDPSPISIEIVDAAGRRVRHVTLDASAGPRLWTWDGRSDDGAPTAPGVYRARAWNASGGMSRPLVRIAGDR